MTAPPALPWLLAIDLGTSNTAAAHTDPVDTRPVPLSLRHGGFTVTSETHVSPDGSITTGEIARNAALGQPGGFIPSAKRLIDQPTVSAFGRTLALEQLFAALIRDVMDRALDAHNRRSPDRVLLTHPEAWSPRQIDVLKAAAGLAGIPADSVATLSEPRAAAARYAPNQAAPGSKICVFDFGGGTLDVAVLAPDYTGALRVAAARGDNALGGKNIDGLVREWTMTQLEARNPALSEKVRTRMSQRETQAFNESLRAAKELLSESPSARVEVAVGGERADFQITRSEFDAALEPVVARAMDVTRGALADAGIGGPEDLAALYLTGGSSRIPLVAAELGNLGPVATLGDPKTAVALGAVSLLVAHPELFGGRAISAAPAMPAPVPAPVPLAGGRRDSAQPSGAPAPLSAQQPAVPAARPPQNVTRQEAPSHASAVAAPAAGPVPTGWGAAVAQAVQPMPAAAGTVSAPAPTPAPVSPPPAAPPRATAAQPIAQVARPAPLPSPVVDEPRPAAAHAVARPVPARQTAAAPARREAARPQTRTTQPKWPAARRKPVSNPLADLLRGRVPALVLTGLSVLAILAHLGLAGPLGQRIDEVLSEFLGFACIATAVAALALCLPLWRRPRRRAVTRWLGGAVAVAALTGAVREAVAIFDVSLGPTGALGTFVGSVAEEALGEWGALAALAFVFLIGLGFARPDGRR